MVLRLKLQACSVEYLVRIYSNAIIASLSIYFSDLCNSFISYYQLEHFNYLNCKKFTQNSRKGKCYYLSQIINYIISTFETVFAFNTIKLLLSYPMKKIKLFILMHLYKSIYIFIRIYYRL